MFIENGGPEWTRPAFKILMLKYHLKYFKGCLPQILLGPFLNTLSHLELSLTSVIKLFAK